MFINLYIIQPFGGDRYSGGGGVVPNYEHMRDVP